MFLKPPAVRKADPTWLLLDELGLLASPDTNPAMGDVFCQLGLIFLQGKALITDPERNALKQY